MTKVTVLGTGAMGSRMTLSLIKAGHDVTVWNRSLSKTKLLQQAGAKVAQTPRLAAKDAEFVISMVRDDEASKQVWLSDVGALSGMNKDAIAIESSTLTVAWTKELSKQFEQRGVGLIDAPVAGTLPQAEAAQLIYFVGGNVALFERAKPILETMGGKINYVGTVGSGMVIKLAVNSLFAMQIAALGELISMITQSGLDETQAVEILAATPVCSPAAKIAATAIVARKFAPLFPIELVEKDLGYAIKTAQENSTQLPLVAATQEIYATAIEQGYGGDNITGIAQLYQ